MRKEKDLNVFQQPLTCDGLVQQYGVLKKSLNVVFDELRNFEKMMVGAGFDLSSVLGDSQFDVVDGENASLCAVLEKNTPTVTDIDSFVRKCFFEEGSFSLPNLFDVSGKDYSFLRRVYCSYLAKFGKSYTYVDCSSLFGDEEEIMSFLDGNSIDVSDAPDSLRQLCESFGFLLEDVLGCFRDGYDINDVLCFFLSEGDSDYVVGEYPSYVVFDKVEDVPAEFFSDFASTLRALSCDLLNERPVCLTFGSESMTHLLSQEGSSYKPSRMTPYNTAHSLFLDRMDFTFNEAAVVSYVEYNATMLESK